MLIFLLVQMLLGQPSGLAVDSQEQLNWQYIDRYKNLAVREMERTGIPASIKLAQGILESKAGTSPLARRSNNHFGIKCGAQWRGETYYSWDDEPQKSCFRVYARVEDGYMAHSNFLRSPEKFERYGFLFELHPFNYRAWAHGLKAAGYATDPNYAHRLIEIIEKYELYRYDRQARLTKAQAQPSRGYYQSRGVIHIPKRETR